MCKPYTKKTLVNKFLLVITILFSSNIVAENNNLSQEIQIKAKRQSADLKNKIASYLDNVLITQGNLTISADLVQVISKTENKIYIAKGDPARFEQKLADGSPIILEAEKIRYEPEKNLITIEGNAKLSQEGSEVSGTKITYNTLTEQLEAESKPDQAVTTILQPTLIEKEK